MSQDCPVELNMIKGDTVIWNLTLLRVTDAEANPEITVAFDLTAATIKFTAKYEQSDADADAVFQKTVGSGITITDATGGLVTVKLQPSDTSSIELCEGFVNLLFDMEVTFGATNGEYVSGDVKTFPSGTIKVKASITTS